MLQVLLEDEGVDVVIVTCTPPRLADADEVARAVADAASAAGKPVLANFILTEGTLEALREGPGRVPWFAYPESAARAVARIAPYAEWVNRPEGSVPVFADIDVPRAREILETALSAEAPGAGPGHPAGAGPVPVPGDDTAGEASAFGLAGRPLGLRALAGLPDPDSALLAGLDGR